MITRTDAHTETNNRQVAEPTGAFFHFLYYRDRGEAGRSLRFINDEVDGGVQVFTTSKAPGGKTYAYTLVFSTPGELTATHFVLQVTRPDAYDLNQTGEEGEERQEKTIFTLSPHFDGLVPFRIGRYVCRVSPELKSGYLAACQAYTEMEQRGCAYFLLTGYEYGDSGFCGVFGRGTMQSLKESQMDSMVFAWLQKHYRIHWCRQFGVLVSALLLMRDTTYQTPLGVP